MMPVYLASMKPETIKNGFRRAGLFPFNSDNLDWSKVEGNERQLEAFHPDETISVQNRVNQGTKTMKPNVTHVKAQTSLSGACQHLDEQHMDKIPAKHQDDMILDRKKEDPAVLCGILARARAWLNHGTVVPSQQVLLKQSWRIIPSEIPWESRLSNVDKDPQSNVDKDPDESDDQVVILPLTYAPGDKLIIPRKYQTDRSKQTSGAVVSQPSSPSDRSRQTPGAVSQPISPSTSSFHGFTNTRPDSSQVYSLPSQLISNATPQMLDFSQEPTPGGSNGAQTDDSPPSSIPLPRFLSSSRSGLYRADFQK